MSDVAEVRGALARTLESAGLPANRAYVSEPGPHAALPPEGVWVVLPNPAGCLVGAVGRGQFRTYAEVGSATAAADLVARLLTTRPPTRPAPGRAALEQAGRATAEAIASRTTQRGGAAGPASLAPGDALDVIGSETGHHAYALGTPLPARSQPPTEAGEYHAYLVAARLADAQEGLAAPWFEQPGGGAMVVLARPVRWYADEGYLVELSPDPG